MKEIQRSDFYKEFEEMNPYLILGLTILTFGMYLINWIYSTNRDLQKIDDFAPDSSRGAIILMIIPFSVFFLNFVLQKVIFSQMSFFLIVVETITWFFCLVLLVKYFYDFSLSFAKVTKTIPTLWFGFFLVGTLGFIFLFYELYWGVLCFLSYAVIVPAMQAELNSYFKKFHMSKGKNIYYS